VRAETKAEAPTNHAAFIWSVADLLRGDYKQSEYGKVILPLTVLRRLNCVLEPTKDKVLTRYADLKGKVENIGPVLSLGRSLVADGWAAPLISAAENYRRGRRSCASAFDSPRATSRSTRTGAPSLLLHICCTPAARMPYTRSRAEKMASCLDFSERATGLEPATLTLAR
jgi:hypothetical protein